MIQLRSALFLLATTLLTVFLAPLIILAALVLRGTATYLLAATRLRDPALARLSALLLAVNVPFLLFARQGRYYSAGGLLLLLILWGFLGDWKRRTGPLLAIGLGLGLLFHANYLLLLSLAPPLLLVALTLYRADFTWKRMALAVLAGVVVVADLGTAVVLVGTAAADVRRPPNACPA